MVRRLQLNALVSTLFGLLVLGVGGAAPARADPIAPGAEHCVVNVRSDDWLNVRTGPSARDAVVTGWRYGQCGIIVLAPCGGDWCRVQDGYYSGWVNRRFIAAVSPALYCVVGVVPGDWLNLRAFPSPESRVLTRLDRQQCGIAFLPYATGNWQKIRVGGWEGWANRRYLSGQ